MSLTGNIDLSSLVRQLGARVGRRTEADIQSDIQTLLLYGGLNLSDPQVSLETPAAARRRIDIEIGQTVIECKRDLTIGNTKAEAESQLLGYVESRSAQLATRYAGILTDGREWILYHFNELQRTLEPVAQFTNIAGSTDAADLLDWLEAVLSTAERLAPTPEVVEAKLGSTSPGFRLDLADLRSVYEEVRDRPDVTLKRELWARLLTAAFGSNFIDDDELFIEHTYLVLTAEIVAHAVMGLDLTTLASTPQDLITGKLFRERGISGVVDEDFFDWPAGHPHGLRFLSTLTRRLRRFDWTDVNHDVLKGLYESVIDAATRHSLGEYYTPDWLAERIVTEIVDDPVSQRVLDPACGSGTFLFWAVRRYLRAADTAGVPNREAVNGVVRHVFGIDLHPVAVTLARVTYLLAIGPRRLQDRDAIAIPVYLGDSIQLGQRTSVLSPEGITVHTSDGLELFARELSFPESVVADAATFDRLIEELARRARDRRPGTVPSIRQTFRRLDIRADAEEAVELAFSVLCDLHDHGRDHIWAYYIRNLARPLEFTRIANQVDRLVGNPPWLRYNAMTAELQQRFREMSVERGLWAGAHVVTSQDLSGLFVVRCCELYLKEGQRFGFVMPAAALTREQYRGFRSGIVRGTQQHLSLRFDRPWELTNVDPDPFPVPASVVFGTRGAPESAVGVPGEALWWSGRLPDHHREWSEAVPFLSTEVAPLTIPTGEYGSDYADSFQQGANLVPRCLLTVETQPTDPLGLPTGQVAIRSDRSSPERPPWREVPTQSGVVEEQFLFPMRLGESLVPFRILPGRVTAVPWDGTSLLNGSGLLIDTYPGFAEWWRRMERIWEENKAPSTRIDLNEQINHMGKLEDQFPVASHRVVYTGRGSVARAARMTDSRAVVDHALYWAAFDSQAEAQYVCGVLNSSALHMRIESSLSRGQFGARNIHRAPFIPKWPAFNPSDPLHRAIADAVVEAERVAANVEIGESMRTADARGAVWEALTEAGVVGDLDHHVSLLLDG